MYDLEFQWLVSRAEQRMPINDRIFKEAFPEFEFVPTGEPLDDLFVDFKQEQAFIAASGIFDLAEDLEKENAIAKVAQIVQVGNEILREHSPDSEAPYTGSWESHLGAIKSRSSLTESGETYGIPTGLKNLDHYLGGLQPGTTYAILGRPGDAKSFFLASLSIEAMLDGCKVGFFSPEMTEFQHHCRLDTILSARPEIQAACGLSGAFKNRDLREGRGFSMKKYKRFLEYCHEELPGEIFLATQQYRRSKMSAAFIESKIDALDLDLVIIDPIYKLKYPRRRESKREEIQDIVDSLQDLSMGFNIPIIISNQANRALVGTRGEPPTKDSSFGSDAPAQESDVVMGLKYFGDERLLKIRCDKNRHGEAFRFEVSLWPNIGKIEDITPIKGENYNGYDRDKLSELGEILDEEKEASLERR